MEISSIEITRYGGSVVTADIYARLPMPRRCARLVVTVKNTLSQRGITIKPLARNKASVQTHHLHSKTLEKLKALISLYITKDSPLPKQSPYLRLDFAAKGVALGTLAFFLMCQRAGRILSAIFCTFFVRRLFGGVSETTWQ